MRFTSSTPFSTRNSASSGCSTVACREWSWWPTVLKCAPRIAVITTSRADGTQSPVDSARTGSTRGCDASSDCYKLGRMPPQASARSQDQRAVPKEAQMTGG